MLLDFDVGWWLEETLTWIVDFGQKQQFKVKIT